MKPASGERPARAHALRISAMGSGGCLVDAAGATFDASVQSKIWTAARDALAIDGVLEAVPGMNNLMLVFDPLRIHPAALERCFRDVWAAAEPTALEVRRFAFPVRYGGPGGEDLGELARRLGSSLEDVVRRHAAGTYTVAAIGAMPGFPYLSGLDPALAWSRRASPRGQMAEGAVIIGGAQAGIMPCTAPSGWHILGHTDAKLFDPDAAEPVLLRPGDRVRFTVASLES